MGYCMEMKDAKFFVPTEYTGRVFAKAEDSSYYFTLDSEGNITDIAFQGEKLYEDFSLFQSLAPYVKDGSYIEMMGEDGEQWRWVFANGKCQEIKAVVTWPEK